MPVPLTRRVLEECGLSVIDERARIVDEWFVVTVRSFRRRRFQNARRGRQSLMHRVLHLKRLD
jgi:hypothetical protein